MTLLQRCDNAACNKVYSGHSAMILVRMWDRTWHFCSGECLSEWAMMHAQEFWRNFGKG